MIKNNKTYFAVCAQGIEPLLSDELKSLGATFTEETKGGVHFDCTLKTLYRVNYETRLASRILSPLRSFSALHSKMIYDQAYRIHWEEFFTHPNATFKIDTTVQKDRFYSEYLSRDFPGKIKTPLFGAQKIKDALVDRLREKTGSRPNVDKDNPSILIRAHFSYENGAKCSLFLDASGASLHQRGYRTHTPEAPLKETLACAIIKLSEWDESSPLYDPMCGSGTIPIEAALIGLKIPPRIGRKQYGFMNWNDFDQSLWKSVLDESHSKILRGKKLPLYGSDVSTKAIQCASFHADRAGVSNTITWKKSPFQNTDLLVEKGTLLLNPPYGERLESGEDDKLKILYKHIGDTFKNKYKGNNAYLFTGNLEVAKWVGLRTSKRIALFNGPIECRLLKYQLY